MLHLVWDVLVGLVAGAITKTLMHAHMSILWTSVLGIIGSSIGHRIPSNWS